MKDLKNIKLVASDCDGVLTDGGMYYLESGDELKKFHVLDGVGFQQLHKQGIKTAILTTSVNKLIERRAEKLRVDDLIMGTQDKLRSLQEVCEMYGFTLDEAVYIGDDVVDIPAIEACGFGCAPATAHDKVLSVADYITKKNGGEGCFREIADLILTNNQN